MHRSVVALLVALIAALALGLAAFFFFVAPGLVVSDERIRESNAEQLRTESQRLRARNDARTAGIQLVGALALIGGGLLTWRTVRLTREGQITDRYAHAIENLDKKKSVATQLGAIYALERIARDSRRDHWPVMEILVGYLRDRVEPWPRDGDESAPVSVKHEAQAVATVLSRRRSRWDGRKSQLRLEGLDLRSVRMTQADLRRANLSESNLSGAFLVNVRLDSAKLQSTLLRGAHLDGATARRADMTEADFTGARLDGVDFRGALLRLTRFTSVSHDKARGLPARF